MRINHPQIYFEWNKELDIYVGKYLKKQYDNLRLYCEEIFTEEEKFLMYEQKINLDNLCYIKDFFDEFDEQEYKFKKKNIENTLELFKEKFLKYIEVNYPHKDIDWEYQFTKYIDTVNIDDYLKYINYKYLGIQII